MNKRGLKPAIFLKKKNSKSFGVISLMKNRKGQVWIETIIYTLIAFVMIGLVLAFAKPKIEELQDKAILEQSLEIVKDIDNTILTMGGAGNQRLLGVNIRAGSLQIDGLNDKLVFEMDGKYLYSQPGETVRDGNILIDTQKTGSFYHVNFTREYLDIYDITYGGEDKTKTISQSATEYNIQINNKGGDPKNIIDFTVN